MRVTQYNTPSASLLAPRRTSANLLSFYCRDVIYAYGCNNLYKVYVFNKT